MAAGEKDDTGVRKLDRKRLSGGHNLSNDSEEGRDTSNLEYYPSSENLGRRPSTTEDEQKVKNLLKEILAYRETNVSSWIVEVSFCRFVAMVYDYNYHNF
jgi:hypothetical protein